jgi:hypothetical protein
LSKSGKFSVGIQGGLGGAFTENSYIGGNEYTTDMLLGIPEVYPVWSHMYNLYFSYGINNDFGIALEPGIIRKGYGGKRVLEEGDILFDRRQINRVFATPAIIGDCSGQIGSTYGRPGIWLPAEQENENEARFRTGRINGFTEEQPVRFRDTGRRILYLDETSGCGNQNRRFIYRRR